MSENFWKDQSKVKKNVKEKNLFTKMVSSFKNSLNEIKNLKEIYSLGLEENNQEILKDCEKKLIEIGKEVKKKRNKLFFIKTGRSFGYLS